MSDRRHDSDTSSTSSTDGSDDDLHDMDARTGNTKTATSRRVTLVRAISNRHRDGDDINDDNSHHAETNDSKESIQNNLISDKISTASSVDSTVKFAWEFKDATSSWT